MSAQDNLSPKQFPYSMSFSHGLSSDFNRVEARTAEGKHVGTLQWDNDPQDNEIRNVTVDPAHRRRGIATAMMHFAHTLPDNIAKPKHSATRSTAGNAWAKSTGFPIPKKNSMQVK
jgi:GNAT superfamily N-acetyltransferase